MSQMNLKKNISMLWLLPAAMLALVLLLPTRAHAAAPGITGPTFNLTAQTAFLNEPDGSSVYAWGYGCNGAPGGFAPAAITGATCNSMQVPGPTLIVTRLVGSCFLLVGWRSCGPADAGGSAGRLGVLHIYRVVAWNSLVLQRNAGRFAGGDGPFWGHHRAAGSRASRLYNWTTSDASRRECSC